MKTFTLGLSFFASLLAITAQGQYCMLPGRTAYSTLQPGITRFVLDSTDRMSSNLEQAMSLPPVVVTGDTITLKRGQTYTVKITHSEDNQFFPGARNNIRVWIDYNSDMDFVDAGETVITKDLEAPNTTYTGTFMVPTTAPLGYTRLRATAKMSNDAGHTVPTSCDMPQDPLGYHGEMEDYTVRIVAPTSVSELNLDAKAAVYPNPTEGVITIAFDDITYEALTASLYDMTGKLVATLADGKTQQSLSYTIDLNDYAVPQGVYFINVERGQSRMSQKVVKLK